MFVHRTTVLLKTSADTDKALNAAVKQQTGIHFRRVNRFILLALYGAHRCAPDHELDPTTGIYLTTENGTVSDTEKGLNQLFRQHIYPKPYNFINTMSNTASFYIAQSLKLNSTNMTITCKDFAFERGLTLARFDLRRGAVGGALIGGADEGVVSDPNLESRYADCLRDGSAWLYASNKADQAIGEIKGIGDFDSRDRAMAWLEKSALPLDPVFAFGARVPEEECATWLTQRPESERFDYIAAYGYFDSAPAAGICLFFQKFKNRTCIHVNRDLNGRYGVVVVGVF